MSGWDENGRRFSSRTQPNAPRYPTPQNLTATPPPTYQDLRTQATSQQPPNPSQAPHPSSQSTASNDIEQQPVHSTPATQSNPYRNTPHSNTAIPLGNAASPYASSLSSPPPYYYPPNTLYPSHEGSSHQRHTFSKHFTTKRTLRSLAFGTMQALKQAIDTNKNVWDELSSAFDQHSNNLKKELQSITESFEELEKQKEKSIQEYGESNLDEEKLIKINVGGKSITTTRGILTQQKGSMLEVLFSGRWEKKLHRDGSGTIFLDMNPACFQNIVDYLFEMKYSLKEKRIRPHCTEGENEVTLKHMIEYFEVELSPDAKGSNSVTGKEKSRRSAELCSSNTTGKAPDMYELLKRIKQTMKDEEKALENAKQELKKATQAWEKEQLFIQNITDPSEKDIINFNVRGTLVSAKRSTLRVFKGSVLERQFDDNVWTEQYANEETNKGWSYKQVTDWSKNYTEIPEEVAILIKKGLQAQSQNHQLFIDHDPYCFGKIIDQHRLKAMSKNDYKALTPSQIKKDEHEKFKKTVDYYFPGELAQLIWEEPSFDSCILSSNQLVNTSINFHSIPSSSSSLFGSINNNTGRRRNTGRRQPVRVIIS